MHHLAKFKNERSSKKRSVISGSDLDSHLMIIGVRLVLACQLSESQGRFDFGCAQVGQFEAFLIGVQVVSHANVEVEERHARKMASASDVPEI
jgi:hypothetical protein